MSFLVTFYNQQKYVDDCLRSISMIEMPCDFEVIVGDDGSIDSTIDEVNKWKSYFGDRLHIYKASREDGETNPVVRASNLRRALMRCATGDYHLILDGDDYYLDSYFVKNALNIFENDLTLSAVMFSYAKDCNRVLESIDTGIEAGKLNKREYIRNHYTHAGACVYKTIRERSFCKRLNSSVCYDDNDILLYHLCFGEAYYVDKIVYAYRQMENSLWNSLSRPQQGLLNTLGADSEAFLCSEFKNDIYYRYRTDVLFSYFRKNYLERVVGNSFFNKYRELSLKGKLLMGMYVTGVLPKEEYGDVEKIIDILRESDSERCLRIEKECSINNI